MKIESESQLQPKELTHNKNKDEDEDVDELEFSLPQSLPFFPNGLVNPLSKLICYSNSFMQFLGIIEELQLNLKQFLTDNRKLKKIVVSLQLLLEKLNSSNSSFILCDSSEFMENFRKMFPDFIVNTQHSGADFFCTLISLLCENNAKIKSLFEFNQEEFLRCQKCPKKV